MLVIGSFGEFSSWQMQVHARPLSCDIPLLLLLFSVWSCNTKKSACAPSSDDFAVGFSYSHFGSDFDILACTVIQIGWAFGKYLDLDDSNGPRAGFEWAVSLYPSEVNCIVYCVAVNHGYIQMLQNVT